MKSVKLQTILFCLILGILVIVGTGCACFRRDDGTKGKSPVRTKGGNLFWYREGEPRNETAEAFYDGMMKTLEDFDPPM